MTILHIDSSLHQEGSITRQLSHAIVAGLTQHQHQAVIYRDLMTEVPPANPRESGAASAL